MARLREFEETEALKSVQEVFWRQGYEGTSYADLMKATGLGKGSLYAAFGDKRALYLKALHAYISSEVEAAVDLLQGPQAKRSSSGSARIKAFLDLVIAPVEDQQDRRGCFLCNAAIDLAQHDADVEQTVQSALERMRDALDKALADLGNASKRRAAVEHLMSVYFGMRVMAKAGTPVGQLKRARDAALRTL